MFIRYVLYDYGYIKYIIIGRQFIMNKLIIFIVRANTLKAPVPEKTLFISIIF